MTRSIRRRHREARAEIKSNLTRGDLESRTLEVLQRGSWANPDVLLVTLRCGQRVVIKDFAPRNPWVGAIYGRWVIGREVKAYRLLAGLPAVPSLLGRLGPLALVLEYRPGRPMSRRLAGRLPPGFMDELRSAIREMHMRGVVHLDLRHRSNVLADFDGHPVLIDFGSAVFFRSRSVLDRLLAPLLARIDWSAVRKWEVRVTPRDESHSPARQVAAPKPSSAV